MESRRTGSTCPVDAPQGRDIEADQYEGITGTFGAFALEDEGPLERILRQDPVPSEEIIYSSRIPSWTWNNRSLHDFTTSPQGRFSQTDYQRRIASWIRFIFISSKSPDRIQLRPVSPMLTP